jgi:coenzyme F420 hydrogenase subunit beta
MAIHLRNSTNRLIPFDDYMVFHSYGFFTPVRCTLCCDLANGLADISCGDAWLPEIVNADNIGTSLLISRSGRGERLVKQASAEGKIALSNIASDKIRTMVSKKTVYKSRSLVAYLSGKKLPHYETELPEAKVSLLRASILYLHLFVARHRFLWGFINPLIRVERLTGNFVRSIGLRHRCF